jgi:hypothetical protein
LAAFDIVWSYLLPSVVFVVCYWRIMMVIKHRQIRINQDIPPTTSRTQQSCTNHTDASSNHSAAATVSTIAKTSTTETAVSHRQLNILQTMVVISASFIILWMPAALTVFFAYFQVGRYLTS